MTFSPTSCWFLLIFNQLLTAWQHVPPEIPLSGCGKVIKTDFNAQPKLWGCTHQPNPHPSASAESLSFTTFCQSLIFMFIAQILALLHTHTLTEFSKPQNGEPIDGRGGRFEGEEVASTSFKVVKTITISCKPRVVGHTQKLISERERCFSRLGRVRNWG